MFFDGRWNSFHCLNSNWFASLKFEFELLKFPLLCLSSRRFVVGIRLPAIPVFGRWTLRAERLLFNAESAFSASGLLPCWKASNVLCYAKVLAHFLWGKP